MAIVHILKDGTVVKDITGHIVREEDVSLLYELIDNINREKSREVLECVS